MLQIRQEYAHHNDEWHRQGAGEPMPCLPPNLLRYCTAWY